MPKSNDYDAETMQVINQGNRFAALMEQPGWTDFEEVFNGYVAMLKDATALDVNAPDVAQQLRDRINTAKILETFMADITGRVNNVTRMSEEDEINPLITRSE